MRLKKLINNLKEHADWGEANIYEVPITLPDDLRRAAAVIKRLDEARERANVKASEYEGRCKMLEKQLEQVKRERDAAVEDINKGRACNICKHFGKGWNVFCCNCEYNPRTYRPNFEWRGVKEAAE